MADIAAQPQVFDVSAQRIARTYAQALVNAAAAQSNVDDVLEELDSLLDDVFPAQPDLEEVLCRSAAGRDRKAALIQSAFAGRAAEVFLNFLLVLNHHDRLDLLRAVRAACRQINDERQQRVRVRVETAVPLPDDQRQVLVAQLRQTLHKEPVLDEKVAPAMLGGLVVRVGDWLYDGSVATQIQNITHQLLERSSHEIQTRRDHFCNL